MGRHRRNESPHLAAAKVLSRRVRERRAARDWSQQRLAQEAGVSIGTIRKIESEAVVDPGVFTIYAIASALGVSVDRLIEQLGPQPDRD